MKKIKCKACKRMTIAAVLGILFGLLCVFLASQVQPDIWGSAIMWSILFNRFLIGFVVFFAGFIVHHPVFGIRMYPLMRGSLIGALVSLDMAIGVFIAPPISGDISTTMVFWMTIIAGTIYGAIIDFVATKYSAEGQDLYNS